jgi:histidine ammonia-lyase
MEPGYRSSPEREREPGAVQVGVGDLSIEDVVRVARDGARVAALEAAVTSRVQAAAAWVAQAVEHLARSRGQEVKAAAYYGINTGFGAQAGRSVLDTEYLTHVLGRNLMASHSVGVGPYLDEDVVRAVLLLRAQSLAQGYSGVRPLVIEALLRLLNEQVYPAIPELGSLGASGDLAPLAHFLLVLSRPPSGASAQHDLRLDATDGEAFMPCKELIAGERHHITEQYATGKQTLWRRVPGAQAMALAGGKIDLRTKEALAIMNGSTVSAAIATLAVRDAGNLLDHAELAVAMTLEGIGGFRDPFYPQMHRARRHPAAERAGARVLGYVNGSQLLDPGDLHTNPRRIPPQDPYSIRCAPQVLGTVADTLELARRWVEMDINAATDNPLIFLDLERDYKTMSGGNFHGEPIAMAMDFLGIALADLGSMSDRRMFMLSNYQPALSSFLIEEPKETMGLNSGLMMLQATAAALVSDCKVLAHPDSVDSIPSSGNQEDHVSMSLNAARHAREIVKHVEHILALEFLCAIQAIALQRAKPGDRERRLGTGTHAAYQLFRDAGIDLLTQDRVLYPDIRKAIQLVRSGSLVRAAKEVSPC